MCHAFVFRSRFQHSWLFCVCSANVEGGLTREFYGTILLFYSLELKNKNPSGSQPTICSLFLRMFQQLTYNKQWDDRHFKIRGEFISFTHSLLSHAGCWHVLCGVCLIYFTPSFFMWYIKAIKSIISFTGIPWQQLSISFSLAVDVYHTEQQYHVVAMPALALLLASNESHGDDVL